MFEKAIRELKKYKNHLILALKTFFVTLLVYIFTICSFSFFPHLSFYESELYFNYAKSIAYEGDLNILNNVGPDFAWLASPSFNMPNMHDHGAPVIWSPFILLARKLFPDAKNFIMKISQDGIFDRDHAVVHCLHLLFAIGIIYLIRHLLSVFFAIKKNRTDLFLILFSTALVNFTLFQPGSADLTLLLYALIQIYTLLDWRRSAKETPLAFYLFQGIILSFGAVIKLTYILWLLPIFIFYLEKYVKEGNKISPKKHALNLFSFAIGYFLIRSMLETNNFIKFGFFNLFQGYAYAFRWEYFFSPVRHGRNFFGPAGLFIVSPVTLLVHLFAAFLIFKFIIKKINLTENQKILLVLLIPILAKHLINLCAIFDFCKGFGARQYLSDSFTIVLGVAVLREYVQSLRRISLYAFDAAIILCTCYSLVLFVWSIKADTMYLSPFNVYYFTDLRFALKYLINLTTSFLTAKESVWSNLVQGSWLFWIIFSILTIINFISLFRTRINYFTVSLGSALILTVLYSVVTVSNVTLNPKNSQMMRSQDRFKSTVIGQGPDIYLYDEYMSILPYAMEVSKFLRDKTLFDFQKNILLNFVDKSKSEVVLDPAHRLKLDNQNYWLSSPQDPSILSIAPTLDYEHPSLFTENLFQTMISN